MDEQTQPAGKTLNRTSTREIHPESEDKSGLWLRSLTFLGWSDIAPRKKLILKLDILILLFGCLSFFTKYLYQQAITNAYVSRHEDLNLGGNDINYINAVFWASYCTSMIPACYRLTRTRFNITLPTLEVGWGLFTFGCAWAQNLNTIYAMRFFRGDLRVVLSYWSHICYRVVVQAWRSYSTQRHIPESNPWPGRMEVGFHRLHHNIYPYLHSVRHCSRTLCESLNLTYDLSGYIVFSDVPHRVKPRFLTTAEHCLANERLKGLTAPSKLRISKAISKRVLGRWHFYVFVVHWILMDQNFMPFSTPFRLYLKANPDIYSISRVNTLPTIVTAISVVAALAVGITADHLRNFCIPSVATSIPVLVGIILLVVYDIGEVGRVAAFIITGFEGAISPLAMNWATTAMANDAEERAIVTASMSAIGQAMAAWTQISQYSAVNAPRFRAGFLSNLVTTVLQFASIGLIAYLVRREQRRQ
ncbi:hypothetical protein N7532_004427 [Penicillium argentinense]|uniref:Uncharacterized protein n=1 Tax=Penicillium argentinense TaxID=1131581 RepID=A0A9W9FPB9_9EURO|nr:uncharacterized protein N7532_004427 [Penicillium argentinense]KAJ5103898.1 hypothetical protein N7532_004427 [Penicillium argentinense]